MSRQHIQAYRRRLDKLKAASGSLNEGPLSAAFADLLDRWGASQDLTLVPQWEGKGPRGNDIRVDGALVPSVLRIPFGYWEAKDSKDDLDREIAAKLRSGYPDDNIVYEDTVTAILRQDGREADRAPLQGDDEALLRLLTRFFAYERPEIAEFRAAARKFRENLPSVLQALREAVAEAERDNSPYAAAASDFLAHARQAINPAVTAADVREMLIQHILTEDIFRRVFDNQDYHRQNNVAQRLIALEDKFFTGDLRARTVEQLRPYYNAIQRAALDIADRREKQRFLKALYEDFYKVYNPKAADRLGVVYTPGEIVRFMIRGAETLCQRHFGRALIDPGVEILDPATGTGTFIVELLEHFRDDRARLAAKYADELHANEVAILPYYVANLNIEATYAAIMDSYAEFPGLVFVDTLDNTAALGRHSGFQGDMFGGFADENLARVKRQNDKPLTLIIGNPPYNAWQSDYNQRNANRPYARIDERIGATYRRRSRARNTSAVSDMYVRFYRWASDRLRDDGILAMVTNRNFIEKVAFDGFRLSVAEEFSDIWIMDLGGDVRANPKLSGTRHNVFGIQTGVCIAFMVRRKGGGPLKLHYARLPEEETALDKLAALEGKQLDTRGFAPLKPDAKGNWLSGEHEDWADYLPLADPTKGPGDSAGKVEAVFRLSSNGVVTQRDDWMWAHDRPTLAAKAKALIAGYETDRKSFEAAKRANRAEEWRPRSGIKWDHDLDRHLQSGLTQKYDREREVLAQFRPFEREWLYFDPNLNGRTYRLPSLYKPGEVNPGLIASDKGWRSEFSTLATDILPDAHALASVDRFFVLTRYRYLPDGTRVDNITDWALRRFEKHYDEELSKARFHYRISDWGGTFTQSDGTTVPFNSPGVGWGAKAGYPDLTKDDIFAYCYAALHDPVWRTTHADDLRREFPRIPLHPDFARWRDWGRTLLDLHLGYETAEPWPLTRVDTPGRKAAVPKLKSLPDIGAVQVDSETQLTGIPAAAWTYRLGNRSAIDWVLDQHKEKTPRDPTVARLFDTYRFADHKEAMIDLLARVVRVSVETVAITEAMQTREGTGAA